MSAFVYILTFLMMQKLLNQFQVGAVQNQGLTALCTKFTSFSCGTDLLCLDFLGKDALRWRAKRETKVSQLAVCIIGSE